MTDRPALGRYKQGWLVDRSRPHIFHRDYWALRYLAEGVRDFVGRYRDELKLGPTLDFGAEWSPYERFFLEHQLKVIQADVEPRGPQALRIDRDGRVPLPDTSVTCVLST